MEHYIHMINVMIPFFQNNPILWSNMFPYPFCSFWNWIINDFSSISHYHDQMIVHQIYWMRIMIYFSFSTGSIIPWIASLNKCSLFVFTQFISHLQRKENSCYIILKPVYFTYYFVPKYTFKYLNMYFHTFYQLSPKHKFWLFFNFYRQLSVNKITYICGLGARFGYESV